MFSRVLAVLVLVLLVVSASAVHAEEPCTLEVFGGYGPTSTKWDRISNGAEPTIRGGERFSLRALLTVPVSGRVSLLIGHRFETVQRGELDGVSEPVLAKDSLKLTEFGFRFRL